MLYYNVDKMQQLTMANQLQNNKLPRSTVTVLKTILWHARTSSFPSILYFLIFPTLVFTRVKNNNNKPVYSSLYFSFLSNSPELVTTSSWSATVRQDEVRVRWQYSASSSEFNLIAPGRPRTKIVS